MNSSALLVLCSLILGAFLCCVYDLFRISRLNRKSGIAAVFIGDVAFSAITVICLLLLFFNLSFGRVRFFAIVMVAIGFFLWRKTVSALYMALCMRLFKLVARIVSSIKTAVGKRINILFRRVYTKYYCNKTVKDAKNGFMKGSKK